MSRHCGLNECPAATDRTAQPGFATWSQTNPRLRPGRIWQDHIGERLGVADRTAIAWLSLDENDSDPIRFLAYLVAGLNRAEGLEATIGLGALDMVQSPQPAPTEPVLTSLINDITAVPDRIVLVLDDYHLIDSSPVDDALTFLLEHLPPQMHLVIATREDPHLPLSRLRARGQLTELRGTDLRVTSFEAAEFLNQIMGLDLSEEEVKALETRTEGWIAGLQLFAIYHHLFADLLRQRLRKDQKEQVPTFHRRASEWYEKNGFADEAIEHALRAEDFDWALHLIEDEVDAVWQRGEHTKLRRWLDRLPAELISSKPSLCIHRAWELFISGHQEAAELSLKAAEQMLITSADPATSSWPEGQDQLTSVDRIDVHNRARAVSQARAFGILPPI